jgi:hypothetical protein
MAQKEKLVEFTIDRDQLFLFAKAMDRMEEGVRKQFIAELKTDLKPLANGIVEDINAKGVPRGFTSHNGRTALRGITASVYVNPGGGKSGSLARIEVFGRGSYKAALKIADLAGTRNKYQRTRNDGLPDRRGDIMEAALDKKSELWKGRGGRYVWRGFMARRREMVDIAVSVLDKYAEKVMKAGIQ